MPFDPSFNYGNPDTLMGVSIPPPTKGCGHGMGNEIIQTDTLSYAVVYYKDNAVGLMTDIKGQHFNRLEFFRKALAASFEVTDSRELLNHQYDIKDGTEPEGKTIFKDIWISEYGYFMDAGPKFIFQNGDFVTT